MQHTSTKKIIEAVGPQVVADCVGVGLHSVRNAKFTGEFPASWFDALEKLCAGKGIECPRSLFSFKIPNPSVANKLGSDKPRLQGVSSEKVNEASV